MTDVVSLISIPLLAVWLLVPVLLFALAAFTNASRNPLKLAHCWRFAERLLVGSLVASALLGLLLLVDTWLINTGLPEQGARLGLYPDGLAVWMAMLVGFIGWVILRFARDYLTGDPARDAFLPWLLSTLACVMVLVFTDHLLILAGAWVGVSLSLHQLLTLYPERPQARLAAAQKFITSRLGDLCVVAGVLLIAHHYGSFRLPELTAAQAAAGSSDALLWASVLLAVAALIKCAQIPFHGWLLRVMEAPTPVSALLHAGVINLGGFLWLRLFPVFDGFTPGHFLLLIVGGTTAVIAVLTMMTQTSVKHALAWSTVAQMGFMLLEIGLGAYVLALLHLLAHSLYKAHSFLASGRTVKVSKAAFQSHGTPDTQTWALALLAGLVAATLLWLVPALVEHKAVLAGLLVLAVTGAVLGIPAGATRKTRAVLTLLAIGLVPLYGLLHLLLGPVFPAQGTFEIPMSATLFGCSLLVALVLAASLMCLAPHKRITRLLHSHFSRGLALEQPFDRATRRLASRWLEQGTVRDRYGIQQPLSTGDRS